MFELYLGKVNTTPRHSALPILISSAAHAVVVAALAAVSVIVVSDELPQLPALMAFVADVPAPPPPPPPPPPAASKKATPPRHIESAPSPDAAPIAVPPRVELERAADVGGEDGVEGGVEGGVPGGVLIGIVGGLPTEVPPPPPSPPPVAKAPVRVGGRLQTPALVRRVEPEYPWLAVERNIKGVVILEATVDEEGRVTSVRVLRTASALLDDAAVRAVRQWRYTPLLLNGIREPFVVTVTLSFSFAP
jgi:protein TonB